MNSVWYHTRNVAVKSTESFLRYTIPLHFAPENRLGNDILLKFNLLNVDKETVFKANVTKQKDYFLIEVSEVSNIYKQGRGC